MTYTIPTDRSIIWLGNVGISSGIPAVDNIYTTLSPNGSDDTTDINNALTNCPSNQVVKLNSGTFYITGTINLTSNKVLRGSGKGTTIVQAKSGFSGSNGLACIHTSGTNDSLDSGVLDISSGSTKGSTHIHTSTAHGLSAGNYLYIDQLNDPSGDPVITNVGNGGTITWGGRSSGTRVLGQWNKITATPTTDSLDLEIPLYWNYSLTPQCVQPTHVTENSGIEDLTFDNSVVGNSIGMQLWYAANCWIYNVELISIYSQGIKIYGGYRNIIRKCTIHEGFPTSATYGTPFGASRGYSIWIMPHGSANLIEDNEFYHVALAYASEGAATGNVFAYNYVHDLYHADDPNDAGSTVGASIALHGAHALMNLFEGNWFVGKYCADCYWGSSSHNTVFRNRIRNRPSGYAYGHSTVDLCAKSSYSNIIANILGTDGFETLYDQNDETGKAIYGLNGDSIVSSTLIRHGNYDYVNDSVSWSDADHDFYNSLYLSTRPNWYPDSLIWPPMVSITPTANDIPAKYRSEHGGSDAPSGPKFAMFIK